MRARIGNGGPMHGRSSTPERRPDGGIFSDSRKAAPSTETAASRRPSLAACGSALLRHFELCRRDPALVAELVLDLPHDALLLAGRVQHHADVERSHHLAL